MCSAVAAQPLLRPGGIRPPWHVLRFRQTPLKAALLCASWLTALRCPRRLPLALVQGLLRTLTVDVAAADEGRHGGGGHDRVLAHKHLRTAVGPACVYQADGARGG